MKPDARRPEGKCLQEIVEGAFCALAEEDTRVYAALHRLVSSQHFQAVILEPYVPLKPDTNRQGPSASHAQGLKPATGLLQLQGLGKMYWRGVNVRQYLDELRDDWKNW